MKKYIEEYFSVREKRTGRKICDCGDFEDARMLMYMDPQNREIIKNKNLMGQVVDIETTKSLPTNELVVVHDVNSERFDDCMDKLFDPIRNKLPEGKGFPIMI
jgi:hypothetical protein